MDLFVERVDVWAAPVDEKPGGLADVLAVLRDAGATVRAPTRKLLNDLTPRHGALSAS